jgi:hypothetical protein
MNVLLVCEERWSDLSCDAAVLVFCWSVLSTDPMLDSSMLMVASGSDTNVVRVGSMTATPSVPSDSTASEPLADNTTPTGRAVVVVSSAGWDVAVGDSASVASVGRGKNMDSEPRSIPIDPGVGSAVPTCGNALSRTERAFSELLVVGSSKLAPPSTVVLNVGSAESGCDSAL